MSKKIFRPEYWQIPVIVSDHPLIQPHDEKVYAVIHWFYRMKEGRCIASNETIAELVKPSNPNKRSVQNSLNRLEELGFIRRYFKDNSKRHRTEIVPLISYQLERSNDDTSVLERSNDDTGTLKRAFQNAHLMTRTRINNNNIEKEKNMSDKSDPLAGFDAFWVEYPKKEKKAEAKKVWQAKKLAKYSKDILSFISQAKETDRWRKGFIKQPTAFLRGECWEDDLTAYNDNQGLKTNQVKFKAYGKDKNQGFIRASDSARR